MTSCAQMSYVLLVYYSSLNCRALKLLRSIVVDPVIIMLDMIDTEKPALRK